MESINMDRTNLTLLSQGDWKDHFVKYLVSLLEGDSYMYPEILILRKHFLMLCSGWAGLTTVDFSLSHSVICERSFALVFNSNSIGQIPWTLLANWKALLCPHQQGRMNATKHFLSYRGDPMQTEVDSLEVLLLRIDHLPWLLNGVGQWQFQS